MLMLEDEGKRLLRSAGIAVPEGFVAASAAGVSAGLAKQTTGFPLAVKVQVHSGGRGKQGGVVKAGSAPEALAAAERLFGTAFAGEVPEAVLLEAWLDIAREIYLAVAVDGGTNGYSVLYSPDGGVDIETKGAAVRYQFGAASEFRLHRLRALLEPVEKDNATRERVLGIAQRLVALMPAFDCSLIEINPLVQLPDGSLIAADAKVMRDGWAGHRQSDIAEAIERAISREPELVQASLRMNHMYVPLGGDIGLISGGAGMTMAAMDMIAVFGGKPACFLDCSPGPTSARGYRPALRMLDADPTIKVILVSVFGGGTQMQRVADSFRELMQERESNKPVVFRLDGTNVDQVPPILAQIGAKNHVMLEDAVKEAIELARESGAKS